MDRQTWLSEFSEKADAVFPRLPRQFTSEHLRQELLFGGVKIVDDTTWWNAGLNGVLRAWQKEGRVQKGAAVRATRKAAAGRLVWTYRKVLPKRTPEQEEAAQRAYDHARSQG